MYRINYNLIPILIVQLCKQYHACTEIVDCCFLLKFKTTNIYTPQILSTGLIHPDHFSLQPCTFTSCFCFCFKHTIVIDNLAGQVMFMLYMLIWKFRQACIHQIAKMKKLLDRLKCLSILIQSTGHISMHNLLYLI